uniref:Uncharacterized protein n=1 Tax=Dunaliella tertiolecta TaxID=3047 RepID=A0A6S8KL66_DUNTE|eukprot:CAMPEP_0202374822 /NCGR_PEP_ID=MMETSP1127-20130417/5586_1 /ASSEMBLY_ACC=CAM_ASM_000462 /TAXON_ID=3047 /ORGANISM="Dunaliella tertiolecta, Strain CCMP1320" /LENGTH=1324 /DNA_ID=CAMNT_0048972091 /DNA_START=3866 /DNA_END=7840 /DNA_ORIENTATION=+
MLDVSTTQAAATAESWESWGSLLKYQACSRRIKEQFTGEVGAKSKEMEHIGNGSGTVTRLEVSQSDIFHALDAHNEAIKQQILRHAGLPTTPSKARAPHPARPASEHDTEEPACAPTGTQQGQGQLPSHTHSSPSHLLKSLSLKLSTGAQPSEEAPLLTIPTQMRSLSGQAADAPHSGWVTSSTSQEGLSRSSSSISANMGGRASRHSDEGEIPEDHGVAREIILDSSIERHHEPPYAIHRMWNPMTNKIQATAKPGDFHIGPQEVHRRELESLRCSRHHADHARQLLATEAAAVALSNEQRALARTNPYFNTPYHTHPRCLSATATSRPTTPCDPYMPQWSSPPGSATTTGSVRSWSQGIRAGSASSHSFRSSATASLSLTAANPAAAHPSRRPFSAPVMHTAHVYSGTPPHSALPPRSPSQHSLTSPPSSVPPHAQLSIHQPFSPSGPPSPRTNASAKPTPLSLSRVSSLQRSHTLSSPPSAHPSLSSSLQPSAQTHHRSNVRPFSAQPARHHNSSSSLELQTQRSCHHPHPAGGQREEKGWEVDQQQLLLLQVPSLERRSPSLGLAGTISPIKEDSQEEELQVFNEAADSDPPELTLNPLGAHSQTQSSAAPHRVPHPSASGDEPNGDDTMQKEGGPLSPQLSPTLSPTLTSRANSPSRYSLFPTPAPSPTVFGLRTHVFNTGHIFDDDDDARQDDNLRVAHTFKGDQLLSPDSDADCSSPSRSASPDTHPPSHPPTSLSPAATAPKPSSSLQAGSRPDSAQISTPARSHSARVLQSPQATSRSSAAAAPSAVSSVSVAAPAGVAPAAAALAIVVPESSRPSSPALLACSSQRRPQSSSSIHDAHHARVGYEEAGGTAGAQNGPPSPLPLPPHLARPLSATLLQRHYEQQQQLRLSQLRQPYRQKRLLQQQQQQQELQQARDTLEVASPTHSSSPLPPQHQQHQRTRAAATPQSPHTHSAGPPVRTDTTTPETANIGSAAESTTQPMASTLCPLSAQMPPLPSSACLPPPALVNNLNAAAACFRPTSAPRFTPTPTGAQPFQPRLRSVQRRSSASFRRPHSAIPLSPTSTRTSLHNYSAPTAAAAAAARHPHAQQEQLQLQQQQQQQQQQKGPGGEGTERMCTWQEVGGALEEGSGLRTRPSSAIPQSKGVSWQVHPTVLATPLQSARGETARGNADRGVDKVGNQSSSTTNRSGTNGGHAAGAAGVGRGLPQTPSSALVAGAGASGSGGRQPQGSAAQRTQTARVPMSARGRAAAQAEQAAKQACKEAEELSVITITMPNSSAVNVGSEKTRQRALQETLQMKPVDMTTAVQGAVAASRI